MNAPVSPVAGRIAAIESRLAGMRATTSTSVGGGKPLGFGLILEKEKAGPPATSAATLGSTGSTQAMGAFAMSPHAAFPSTHVHYTGGPPPELEHYGNGHIPREALAPVGSTGHHMWAPAAAGLTALLADAQSQGIDIGITDSYRPYEVQVGLAEEKGLYSQGGLAATPGTSNHGWGLSTDLDLDDRALSWMRQNAWRYGFVEDVPREPWHWTYKPNG